MHVGIEYKISLKKVAMVPTFILLIFILSSFLTSGKIGEFLFWDKVFYSLKGTESEQLLRIMSIENPHFSNVLSDSEDNVSYSNLALNFITNVELGDVRSLLGNELPGFSIYDTRIYIAGKGTNYTNTPIESPPPREFIKNQREQHKPSDENKEQQSNQDHLKNPDVFVYSTHSWEAYFPLMENISPKKRKNRNNAISAYNKSNSVLKIGSMLEEALEDKGVNVVANQTNIWEKLMQKGWQYPKSYKASRPLVKKALKGKTKYKLFIDIHRDALRHKDTTVTINNKEYARVAFVIGKEYSSYKKNYLIASDLHKMLEDNYPGISRGVFGKGGVGTNGVFNQDLSPKVILIEVGGVDNTLKELKNTVEALSSVIAEYVKNAQQV